MEKIQLRALDEIIWVASCFIKYVIHHEHFSFDLGGETLPGEVHSWWKDLDTSKPFLQVKTVDLKSAHKQFAIHPSDRRLSVLALKKPETGEVAGFVSRTLPFGSTASVLHFTRASRLLHRIGLELDVAWTNYYDDYPVVEFSFLAANTTHTIRALTSLLGFECSTDKELPFANEADMLGVVLDVSKSGCGVLSVKNKESRMEELAANLQSLIDAGKVDPKKLPSLFGRALFVERQISGRLGKLLCLNSEILSGARRTSSLLTPCSWMRSKSFLGDIAMQCPGFSKLRVLNRRSFFSLMVHANLNLVNCQQQSVAYYSIRKGLYQELLVAQYVRVFFIPGWMPIRFILYL